ncbi:MAG: hypothetical protein ABR548_13260 [Actinomycetota bacterium]
MAKTKTFQKVKLHDIRVVDQVLADSDPNAGNVIYVGTSGSLAYPFVVARRVSGPGGWYVDTCRVMAAGRFLVTEWDRTFELEGESVDQWVTDVKRHLVLPGQGNYTLQYSVYGKQIIEVDFHVIAQDPPYVGIVPGPVDAGLAKGTIAWLTLKGPKGNVVSKPVWYGYENGILYVLTGDGEQKIPGLLDATSLVVSVRSKEKQSLIGEMECSVRILPKGPDWDAIARDVLIGRRLNLTDGDKAIDRWRKSCEITVLTPIPPEVAAG